MRIRRTEDHELILRLDRACLPLDTPMLASTIEDSDWWIAEDAQGEPVGYGGLYTRIAGEGWLVRAGVVAQARGRGLQQRLIRARLRRAVVLGLPRVYTYTMAENVPSNRSLAACGLVPYKISSGALYWYWRAPSVGAER